MTLGNVVMFVPDLVAALSFYESAFGLRRRFVDDGGVYAELESGASTLAFAAETVAVDNGVSLPRRADPPAGIRVAFVVDEVSAAFARAIGAGAEALSPPSVSAGGHVVAYVRDCFGAIVELSGEPALETAPA